MSSEAMTTAEYAVHRGCSDSYIRRMRRTGKLVMHADGKRIQVEASDALLDDITDPVRGGDRTAGAAPRGEAPLARVLGSDVPSVQEAVRRERLAKAQLAELELGELSKALTRTKDVDRAVFTLVRQALNAMMNLPARLRAKLAAETDPRAIEALLEAEVRKIAGDMQQAGRGMQTSSSAIDQDEDEAA